MSLTTATNLEQEWNEDKNVLIGKTHVYPLSLPASVKSKFMIRPYLVCVVGRVGGCPFLLLKC